MYIAFSLREYWSAGVVEYWKSNEQLTSEWIVILQDNVFPTYSRAVFNASSPNTPVLHHSSTPYKQNVTAEPSLSDPRNAGSSTVPEDQVFHAEINSHFWRSDLS